MKKNKIRMVSVVLLSAVLLGGCGDKPYELTEQEEDIIVNYSAHIVSKYNSRQALGLQYVNMEQAEEPESEEEETAPPEAEEPSADEASPENAGGGTRQEEQQSMQQAGLGELFGSAELSVEYVGARVSDSYVEGEYYALDSPAGKVYLIVGIDLTNQGTEPVEVNYFTSAPKFTAVVNGSMTADAEITLLDDDFSTLEATLAAGETKESVLLFEVPDTTTSVDTLELRVSINGETYQINL